MQCENCGQRPAEVHLTQIVNNSVSTTHLCSQCAAEKGVQTDASIAKLPLSDFLASIGAKGAAAAAIPAGEHGRCPSCGATLEDFRETGRLGCADCYGEFERQLRDLLRRLHGSSRHVGEVYLTPSGEGEDRVRYLGDLKEQLRRAVDAENFELAAELRDRIKVYE